MLENIEVAEGGDWYFSQGCLIDGSTKTLIRATRDAVIPDDGSVDYIGQCAFAYLSDIRSVVIPDSVTHLDANVFVYCVDLEAVVIGKGVQFIDQNQFIGSDNFSTIYYCGTQSQWDKIESIVINSNGGFWGRNEEIKNATIYFYSETEPTQPGNYWRYVDGVPTPWETQET